MLLRETRKFERQQFIQWCVNHRIHLAICGAAAKGHPALVDVPEFAKAAAAAHAMIAFFINSPLKTSILRAAACGAVYKFILSVRTRWNSEADSLARVVQLWDAIVRVKAADIDKTASGDFAALRGRLAVVINTLKSIVPILERIKKWSETLSSSAPTLGKVSLALDDINTSIATVIEESSLDTPVARIAIALRAVLNARIADESVLERAACYLNPQRWLKLRQQRPMDKYMDAAVQVALGIAVPAPEAPIRAAPPAETGHAVVVSDFARPAPAGARPTQHQLVRVECGTYEENVHKFGAKHSLVYAEDADPERFWNEYGTDTPALFAAARLLIATPASSAGVERTFSSMGIISSATRSQLSPAHIEMLTMLHASAIADDDEHVASAVMSIDADGRAQYTDLVDPVMREPPPEAAAEKPAAAAGAGAMAMQWADGGAGAGGRGRRPAAS
jgi:hypothetical protein